MADIVVRAEKLSKEYRIGPQRRQPYRTLRETLTNAFGSLVRVTRPPRSVSRIFPALTDVSFQIKAGEVVGVIGRNGAGKSTLLKILSRITEPTRGSAQVCGRLASLLEVGTGFHPELSGRENIYLNSAILGMKRSETQRQFDEIVAFAEVEDFIDTPVKYYSSGMYLRLAFAVAAHLRSDILIVDEVLAVGDARFQKKCLDKMRDVSEHGRTIMFVSHDMPAITRLCERVLLLEQGVLVKDGPAAHVVSAYLHGSFGTTAAREWSPQNAPGGDVARLVAVRVRADDGRIAQDLDIRRPVSIEVEYEVRAPDCVLVPHFKFANEDGIDVFSVFDADREWQTRPRPLGRYVSTVVVPGNFLAEGTLFVTCGLFTSEPVQEKQFYERDVVAFQVVDTLEGDSARGRYAQSVLGVVRPLLPWTTRVVEG